MRVVEHFLGIWLTDNTLARSAGTDVYHAMVDRRHLRKPFEPWLRDLLQKLCFEQIPLDASIIVESRSYSFNDDIFAAAIVATARLQDVPLITKDVAISSSGLVEIDW